MKQNAKRAAPTGASKKKQPAPAAVPPPAGSAAAALKRAKAAAAAPSPVAVPTVAASARLVVSGGRAPTTRAAAAVAAAKTIAAVARGVDQARHDAAALDPFALHHASAAPAAPAATRAAVPAAPAKKGVAFATPDAAAAAAAAAAAGEEATPEALLKQAHHYFTEANKQEQQLVRKAKAKISEMKRINRQGGDKDGFKYVVPRSVKRMVSVMQGITPGGAPLQNSFNANAATAAATGEGGDEDEQLSRRLTGQRKAKPSPFKKDFYAVQVWKQWTKNAENFLQKGAMGKKIFAKRNSFKSF